MTDVIIIASFRTARASDCNCKLSILQRLEGRYHLASSHFRGKRHCGFFNSFLQLKFDNNSSSSSNNNTVLWYEVKEKQKKHRK